MRAVVFLTFILAAAGCAQVPDPKSSGEAGASLKNTPADPLDYHERIRLKVKSLTTIPSNTPADAEVVMDILILPGGTILKMEQVKSSGFKPYEQAISQALRLAEPLPVPNDYESFQRYRRLLIVFRPY